MGTLFQTPLCLAVLLVCHIAMARQPNVVVILTDDQGWGDLSVHGNTNLSTPHLDSLARDGASFDHFYVCQICAPTRAEFLTGRYPPQTGVSGVSRGQGRLNPDETTIADIFRKAGYATGAFGKWHNGTQPPYHPNDRGFAEFYGFTSGHWGHYFSPPLDRNRKRVRGNGFIIDDFTDRAISFIEANRDQPFFCYVPFNTPHSPMFVPDRWYEKFDGKEIAMKNRDPDREDIMMTRAALALCENIDWNVGRILKKLDELKLRDDTIVVYFSDNGPNSYRWNGGMKGRKGSIDEGGLRSPLFVRWPQKIRAGLRVAQVGGAIDLLPTLTDLVGIEVSSRKPINGMSLAPRLRRVKADYPNRSLFSIKRNQVSVRTQRFRLDASGKLFDIAADPGQRNDVSQQHPIETRRLKEQAARFNQQMQKHFQANADRPFTVGYGQATTLTARDGVAHGTIQRSSKAPNNSFFTNWTKTDDSITWNIDVGTAGDYEATVFYTCAAGDKGARIRLSADKASTAATVKDAFDPPLYDKSKERVEKSHYFVKDFKPLSLGTLSLKKGRATLKLEATKITGTRAIDVQAIDLVLKTKD